MKVIIRYLIITILAFVFLIGMYKISKSRTFQFFGGIVSEINTNKKVVALTFDDGPTKENTDRILQILKELNVKATFFITGHDLEQNLDEGKKIVLSGHELGNHSYSHRRMVLRTLSFINNEIEATDKLIRQTGYIGDISFRPPNGKKLLGLPYYLKINNRKIIMWNLEPDSLDDIKDNPEKMIQYVNNNIKPGSIILMHVMYKSREASINSINNMVKSLQSKGYEFVTVSELIKAKK